MTEPVTCSCTQAPTSLRPTCEGCDNPLANSDAGLRPTIAAGRPAGEPEVNGIAVTDRDRLLLAFAQLASYGVAARPSTLDDGLAIAAELRASHPRGLGSYIFYRHDDETAFSPAGELIMPLMLHCSGAEVVIAAQAACAQMGLHSRRVGPRTLATGRLRARPTEEPSVRP